MKNGVAIGLLESIDNYLMRNVNDYGERNHEAMQMAMKALKQEKVGKWVFSDIGIKFMGNKLVTGTCSVCGFKHDFIDGHTAQYQYCPSCGAKMEDDNEKFI